MTHNGCINTQSHTHIQQITLQTAFSLLCSLKGCRLRELLHVQILGECVVILGSVYTWRCVEYCAWAEALNKVSDATFCRYSVHFDSQSSD